MPRDSVAVAKAHGLGLASHHDDDDADDGETVDAFRPGKKRMPRDSVAVAKARGMGLHDDADDDDDVSTLSLDELVLLEGELEAKLRGARGAPAARERRHVGSEEGEAFRPGGRTKVSRARDSMAVAKARSGGGGGGDRLSVDLEVDGAGGKSCAEVRGQLVRRLTVHDSIRLFSLRITSRRRTRHTKARGPL